MIGLVRRSRRRHVRNFKADGAFLGSFAAASQFDQGRKEIEAVNDTSRRRRGPKISSVVPPPHPISASLQGAPRFSEPFIDRLEHRFNASELDTPFSGPVQSA